MTADFANREVVLWGARGHALVLCHAIADLGGRVIAVVDNDPSVQSALPDLPLLHGLAGLDAFLEGRHPAAPRLAGLVAIGGGRGVDRRSLASEMTARGIDMPALVHPRAFICDGVTLGQGTQVLAMASVAAGTEIGSGCIVNHGTKVDHECQLADGTHLAPGAILCGLVRVGEDAFVGAGAVVLPRIQIGRGATVGAGAVVTADVAPSVTVVGIPARPLEATAPIGA